jgi:Flp pilus assembly protein TadB
LAAAQVDADRYLAGQAAATILAGLAAPVLGLVLLGWSGQTPIWTGLAGAGLGWWYSRASLRADANRERGQVRHALSVMLTLMSVSLARGAGIEQALDEAASVCRGPGAGRLTSAIRTARLLRRPPWEALGDLGRAAAITDLSDLAAAMTLAGTDGARIRAALTARAAAMRATATARAHTDAERATSAMTLPLLLLSLAYLVFLLFPALAALQLSSFP